MFTGPCCLLFVSAPFSSLVSAAVNSHSPPLPVPNQTAMSYISILNCKFNFGSKDPFFLIQTIPKPASFYILPKIHKTGIPGRLIVSSKSHVLNVFYNCRPSSQTPGTYYTFIHKRHYTLAQQTGIPWTDTRKCFSCHPKRVISLH